MRYELTDNEWVAGTRWQPDVRAKPAAMAYVPIGNSPEQCTAFFKAEIAKWSKVIKDAGLKAE